MRLGLGLRLRQLFSGGAYAAYALALDFKNGQYKDSSGLKSSISTVNGYTYTRSAAKSEVKTSDGSVVPFAANVPGIVSGDGYWSRAAMTNLVPWSQQFENASWFKGNSTATANSTTAPDGTVTADTVTATATGVSDVEYVTVAGTASTTYTASVYFKQGTASYGYIQINQTGVVKAFFVPFDLATGTPGAKVDNVPGLTVVSTSSTAAPNGFYRCAVTYTLASDATGQAIYIGLSDTAATRSATAGRTAYLWQAQIVAGSQPGPIILTTSTTATVGADALSVSLANGTYSAVYTFDDASTQTISTTIAAASFAMPVYPTTLNRPLVRLVTLK